MRLSATTYPACRPTVSPSVQKQYWRTQLTRISHFSPFNVAKRCQRNSPDNGPRYLMKVPAPPAVSAYPMVVPPAPLWWRWNPDPSPCCCFWCRCWRGTCSCLSNGCSCRSGAGNTSKPFFVAGPPRGLAQPTFVPRCVGCPQPVYQLMLHSSTLIQKANGFSQMCFP